jgi:hypothetical protein
MKNNIKYLFFTIISLSVFAACNDLDQYPTNQFTDETYWTSADKASSVLNMAYSQMYNSGYFFSTEALSDNIYQTRVSDEKTISSGQANAATGRFASEWSDCYAGIKTCHTFLENVDRVQSMDEATKARMKAEARFIRAFLFFRLATWYGDIPLFTKDITLSESKTITRTAHAEVLTFIRTELEEIVGILPSSYASSEKGRITSGAALALKARTYLYENDWDNTASTCERLISGDHKGVYELFPNFSGLFTVVNEYNSEVILDMTYIPSLRMYDNFRDYVPNAAGLRVIANQPTQELVEDFIMLNGKATGESGSGYDENNPFTGRDPRLDASIVHHGSKFTKLDGSVITVLIDPAQTPAGSPDRWKGSGEDATLSGYYILKYYDPTAVGEFQSSLNLILIRYADILLMYAEAKNELGQMNETVWNQTIKAIRSRAGFSDSNALNFPASASKDALRDIIRRERHSELAFEGTRIFDLRRWKTAEIVFSKPAHGAKYANNNTAYIEFESRSFNPQRDYLWAVPQGQKDINPALGQNNLY